jgi:peptide/nickel transport system permease protein
VATTQERSEQTTEAPVESGPAHRSLRADVWRQFRRHKGAVVGLVLLGIITLASFLGPIIWDADPFASEHCQLQCPTVDRTPDGN